MENVKIEKIYNGNDLIELLEKIYELYDYHPKLKLIIIDSLPVLYHQYHNEGELGEFHYYFLIEQKKLVEKFWNVLIFVR